MLLKRKQFLIRISNVQGGVSRDLGQLEYLDITLSLPIYWLLFMEYLCYVHIEPSTL